MEEEKKHVDKEVIGKVRKTHTQISELTELLRVSLPYLNSEKQCQDVKKVINFLQDNIAPHFDYEENRIFGIVLIIGDLEIKQTVRTLQQEHIFILSKFDKIKEIVFKHGFSFHDQKVKDEFIALSKEIITLLLQHARKEDEELLPYLEEKGIKMDIDFKE